MGYEADTRWVNCLPENELIRMEKLIRSKGISEEDVQKCLKQYGLRLIRPYRQG